jgi:hypothetical protein
MPIILQNTSITGLAAGGLPSGTVNATTLADGAVTREKLGYSGAIIQVVMSTYTAAWSSSSSNNWINLPLTATITPTSSSSKILVMINHGSLAMFNSGAVRVLRNGSAIQVGDAAGSRNTGMYSHAVPYFGDFNWGESKIWRFLDSPGTTSAVTYQPQGYSEASGSSTVWFNYGPNDPDSGISYAGRVASNIILMEVKG